MEELAEYEVEGFKEPFAVNSDEEAAWAMRQLKELVGRQLSNQSVADKERGRIDEWLSKANGTLQHRVDYFRGLLIDYMRKERDKRKSISTPYGVVKSSAVPLKYEPDGEFIDWAKVNARHLLRFKDAPPPEPDKAAIKAAIKKGEPIEHVEVVEGGVNFSVELS